MAAKKKGKKSAKASRKPEPAQRPAVARAQAAELPAPDVEIVETRPERPGPPVAGIGASAGGLDAFKKFFTAMPADSGIAFVLIPHLDPKHESLMVELIARHTSMPVAEAADGMAVEANHIYVIPPNKYMTISGGALRLTGPVERAGPQTSIDLFLRSLADDKQEDAICIILSGTGAHGTLGLQAVKAAGGLAMVQDPATADYPLMPQSAIATGLADYILPVEQMPGALKEYMHHFYVNGGKAVAEGGKAPDELNQVLVLLRARTRLDFRCYKKKMLARRIERRMSLSHCNRVAAYLACLREHPDEVKHLSRDLLISVTSFFREPEAWLALETEVIAPLLRSTESDESVRAWCVGCATGEEPYSLGMLLLEQLAAAQKSCRAQIFATDVDDDALEVARQANYPESISADVSPERLARFFTRVSDSAYQVGKQLREIVVFARQNLISDAPFSKLDLVVCRNLLIYLEPETQRKVLSLLHFSLNSGGFLFLGPSETIGRNVDQFEPVSAKWRIYRRIGPNRIDTLQLPVMRLEPRRAKAQLADRQQPPLRLAELAQSFLLRRFALGCVVINRNCEILHFAGPTEEFLIQPGGPPTQDLLALARPGLESKLRVVIQRAIRQNAPQSIKDVMMRHAGTARRVNIDVEPLSLSKQTEGLLLVAFHEQPQPSGETPAEARARSQMEDSALVRQLEQELETTREDLQSTIEELESSNEELKASNEESMSMNEELQSTNEELETSKEELQSLNEELSTVNSQLQEKVCDLEAANNDMANLLNCTEIATVFLDTGFRIKFFTAATTRMFNLIASDVGRPLGDIARKFTDDDLLRDAVRFLHDLTPREKEVRTEDGRWCVRRILPYRTHGNRIEGLVITFDDISQVKRADEQSRLLATVVHDSNDAVTIQDLEGRISAWNRGAEQMYGYAEAEALGMNIIELIPEELRAETRTIWQRLVRGQKIDSWESRRIAKDGRLLDVWTTATPLLNDAGQPVAIAKTDRDVTERNHAAQAFRESEDRLRQAVNAANMGTWDWDLTTDALTWDRRQFELFGIPREEFRRVGAQVIARIHPEDRSRVDAAITDARDRGVTFREEFRVVHPDGSEHWLVGAGKFVTDASGKATRMTGVNFDITDRKQAETALRRLNETLEQQVADRTQELQTSEQRFRLMADGAPVMIWMSGTDKLCTWFNKPWLDFTGRPMEQELGDGWTENIHPDDVERCRRTYTTAFDARQPFTMEYRLKRHDGEYCWMLDTGTPFFAAGGEFAGFIGSCIDITRRKELEREVVEIASLQQQRIGQDLHDTVGQELTALNLLVGDLAETVRNDPEQASQLVEWMAQGLRRSQQELRDALRGLLFMSVETQGLTAALSDLADRVQRDGKVHCTLECLEPVAVADNLTVTHLYLIAQEAVHNAIKHAQARNVHITLKTTDGCLVVGVLDDGIGMPSSPTEPEGLGLRIMRNRAATLGAKLTIAPGEPRGTVVTCVLPRKNDEPE